MRISDWSSDVCSSDLLGRLIGRDELADRRIVFVLRPDGDDIGVRIALARLAGDRVGLRIETGLERAVGVDHRRVDVVERTRELGGTEFYDLKLARVPGALEAGWV